MKAGEQKECGSWHWRRRRRPWRSLSSADAPHHRTGQWQELSDLEPAQSTHLILPNHRPAARWMPCQSMSRPPVCAAEEVGGGQQQQQRGEAGLMLGGEGCRCPLEAKSVPVLRRPGRLAKTAPRNRWAAQQVSPLTRLLTARRLRLTRPPPLLHRFRRPCPLVRLLTSPRSKERMPSGSERSARARLTPSLSPSFSPAPLPLLPTPPALLSTASGAPLDRYERENAGAPREGLMPTDYEGFVDDEGFDGGDGQVPPSRAAVQLCS